MKIGRYDLGTDFLPFFFNHILTMRKIALVLSFLVVLSSCKNEMNPEGQTKNAIMAYVKGVTTEGGVNFIPEMDRVATFDNDGNLWSEQPAYFQLFFAMDRIKALAAEHPEWKTTQP